MTTSTNVERPEAVSLGAIGLFTPFALVMIAVLVLGTRSPAQIAMTLALLAAPLAILWMRRNASRTH